MLNTTLAPLLSLLLLFSFGWNQSAARLDQKGSEGETGTLEKMIVANGSAALDIDLSRLNGGKAKLRNGPLRFALVPDSFFTIIVFNGELRGPLPSAMGLVPLNVAPVPAQLQASYRQLVIESTAWGAPYELVVRDGSTGFVFFNIEGHEYDYNADRHALGFQSARLLLSREFAEALGRPGEAGSIVGKISLAATMRAIEITRVANGEVESDVMPARLGSGKQQPAAGSVPGPDVIVGDLSGLTQPDASSGTQVGLAVATDSCNAGTVDLDWFQTPSNDHPVIPQNFYRMSGGASNNDRFEQIGQSSVKHAFTALTQNLCGFGCNGVGGSHLGSGCSDPYSASLNSGGSGHTLGSRAWINPFTGAYPRGDSATPPNSHTGHTHTGPSHRMLVEINDLNTSLNPGATYYVEAQYITPHEYVWCQANPTQCNMYNNVSHRRYIVNGTGSPFTFSTGTFTTVREKPAINEWTGSTSVQIQPAPGSDGIGVVAYKVTNPSPGVWHYEYAVYNQNLDRGISSFTVPVGGGVMLSNIGFHAPPQHPGWAGDGTLNNAGYSSTPWAQALGNGAMIWSTEKFSDNQNANAIRWGTLYNFRFDADTPPQTTNATVGFFKTGAPITVQIQGPSTPVATTNIFARDGQAAEPANGTSPLLFTVALSAPAGASGVSMNYATAADTGGANPATGGADCTGPTDYINTSGTVNFASGERIKTVAVNVCADATTPEPNETLLLNLSNATNGNVLDSQAVGTITDGQATPASLLISELRTSGPGGLGDDFVELYNNGNTSLTVAASDASAGYGVYKLGADCNATPTLVGTVTNGTVIPPRGHYLLVGSQYGLGGNAAGDQPLTADIESDRNVAVYSTADIAAISSANRLDGVGFDLNPGGNLCALLREGTTLPAAAGSTAQYSFVRKQASGTPQDTNDNAQDFVLVATDSSVSIGGNATPWLGAPGPENLASPIQRNIKAALIDPFAGSTAPPNRVRDTTPYTDTLTPSAANGGDPAANPYALGTLVIRRKFTNSTGAFVTRLRVRVIDITSTNATPGGAGQADLRALTSTTQTVTITSGGSVTVQGLTLEQPPAQARGGGLNSSLAAGTINLTTPLANGASVNVNLLLGVAQGGSFRFFINVEAVQQ
ncbi:MAG TPA: hypothetical protein VF546_03805 [Pyrinomonadaceae bacterium]|jgi:hypothetical protein